MADNNSKKNRSQTADKIVAAILVFLIFGAGAYGIAREAGNMASRADTANPQTDQENGKEEAKSGNEADAVVIDQDDDKGKDGNVKDPAEVPDSGDGQDKDEGQTDAKDQGQDNNTDAADNSKDDPSDGDSGAQDDGTIPADKRKLDASDVRKAFGTDKTYMVVPVTATGAGTYNIDADAPLRRFPTLKAGVVATIKAPATIYVNGFTDGGSWAQVSFSGYTYYIPAWCLGGKADKPASGNTPFVSGDVSDNDRFAAVLFQPTDPAKSQYKVKADAPAKDAPSYSADDKQTIPAGTPVNVTAISDNGWAKVTYGGNTYYVNTSYLDPAFPQDDGQDTNDQTSQDKDSQDGTSSD
ncbi:MAG: SH3 domain-containing protein, partial [Clostridiales bacterium]|nr:SH3 domain-containing protein [Clostridiales bacterium]